MVSRFVRLSDEWRFVVIASPLFVLALIPLTPIPGTVLSVVLLLAVLASGWAWSTRR